MMQEQAEEARRREAEALQREAANQALLARMMAQVVGGGAGADGASSSNQPQGTHAPSPTQDAIPRPGAASSPRTGPPPPSGPGIPPPPEPHQPLSVTSGLTPPSGVASPHPGSAQGQQGQGQEKGEKREKEKRDKKDKKDKRERERRARGESRDGKRRKGKGTDREEALDDEDGVMEVDEGEPLKTEAAEEGVVVKEEEDEEVQPAQAAAPAAPLGLHSGQAPDGHPPPPRGWFWAKAVRGGTVLWGPLVTTSDMSTGFPCPPRLDADAVIHRSPPGGYGALTLRGVFQRAMARWLSTQPGGWQARVGGGGTGRGAKGRQGNPPLG